MEYVMILVWNLEIWKIRDFIKKINRKKSTIFVQQFKNQNTTYLSGSEMEYEFRLFDMVSSDLCVRIDRRIDRDLLEGFRTDILNQ